MFKWCSNTYKLEYFAIIKFIFKTFLWAQKLHLQCLNGGESAMKVVILAGGFGTRLSEETHLIPKPMVEIGGRPILWHIMKCYSHYGFDDFIICGGYKCDVIKNFFNHYFLYTSDVTFDFKRKKTEFISSKAEDWRVTIVDTGLDTMTGSRVKKIQHLLNDNEPFFLTYGDGVCDLNFRDQLNFHKSHGKMATVLAVTPPGRFGSMTIEGEKVTKFIEKPQGDNCGRINGGFFIFNKPFVRYLTEDDCSLESGPLDRLACQGQLVAHEHDGFWFAMDTLRDKNKLDDLWKRGSAPWKMSDRANYQHSAKINPLRALKG